VLEEVHDRILSGEICTREEAIAVAMDLFSGALEGNEDRQE